MSHLVFTSMHCGVSVAPMSKMGWTVLLCFSLLAASNLVFSLPEYCGKDTVKYTPLQRGPNGETYELKQVNVLIRHGDRTRANSKPCWNNDIATWDCLLTSASLVTVRHDFHDLHVERVYRKAYIEGRQVLTGNCAIGHLTTKGFKQQEMNGEFLRGAYVKSGFLTGNYSHQEVFIRSDDMSRTMQSAQALATTLFPQYSLRDAAEVVDIHTMDQYYDDIEPNPRLCPRLDEYNKEFYDSDAWKKHFNETTRPLLDEIQKVLGIQRSLDLDDLRQIGDCLSVHVCHDLPVPSGLKALYDRIRAELTEVAYSMLSYPSAQRYARAGIGFLVKEIWQSMQRVMDDEPVQKFLLYSGHDFTLMPFLKAFNVSDGKWTPYASLIQLELYAVASSERADAGFAVRFLYQGQELKLPFCDSSPCPAAQFADYVKAITPEDPAADCKVINPKVLESAPAHFLPSPRIGTEF